MLYTKKNCEFKHETHKIDTFLQKEFLRLQINPEVHNAFVLSLESLSDNDLSRNSEVVSHDISNIQNLPDHVIFTAVSILCVSCNFHRFVSLLVL
jgi:hypothetical protein